MRTLVCLLLCAGVAAAEEPALTGTAVSQPLQPVKLPDAPPKPPEKPTEIAPEEPPAPTVEKEVKVPARYVRPKSWSSYELLMWWSKAQPLPPLAAASTNGTAPVLGAPGTVTLVGGNSLGDAMTTGFRFTMGWNALTINDEDKLGFEFTGTFLGTRESSITFADSSQGRFTALGRPFVDASSGQAGALIVSGFGAGTGAVTVGTTTRVQGWEVNLTHNIVDAGDVTVTALLGYRQMSVNEGLHIQQSSLRFPAPGAAPNVLIGLYDQFDARNSFHGAQIGLRIDSALGRWVFGFTGKIAYGANFETVTVQGNGSLTTPALPLPAVQPIGSGFLATGTNIGRTLQSEAAVLPEGRLSLGCQLSESCHFVCGYDFLYLSNAVRPGDQVDLAIDPSRSPLLNTGAPFSANRPRVPFAKSEFWVQGLTLGLDYRY